MSIHTPAAALLRTLLAYQADAFESDQPIDGANLVDFISEFRQQAQATLDASPQPSPPRVVIAMEGGLISAICTPDGSPLQAVVIDYDTDGADFRELTEITQSEGHVIEAAVASWEAEQLHAAVAASIEEFWPPSEPELPQSLPSNVVQRIAADCINARDEARALRLAGDTLASLLEDAISTHIYDPGIGDKQPDDCAYKVALEVWDRCKSEPPQALATVVEALDRISRDFDPAYNDGKAPRDGDYDDTESAANNGADMVPWTHRGLALHALASLNIPGAGAAYTEHLRLCDERDTEFERDSEPASTPAQDETSFHVSARFATSNGEPASWTQRVFAASHEEALATARSELARAHPGATKVDMVVS